MECKKWLAVVLAVLCISVLLFSTVPSYASTPLESLHETDHGGMYGKEGTVYIAANNPTAVSHAVCQAQTGTPLVLLPGAKYAVSDLRKAEERLKEYTETYNISSTSVDQKTNELIVNSYYWSPKKEFEVRKFAGVDQIRFEYGDSGAEPEVSIPEPDAATLEIWEALVKNLKPNEYGGIRLQPSGILKIFVPDAAGEAKVREILTQTGKDLTNTAIDSSSCPYTLRQLQDTLTEIIRKMEDYEVIQADINPETNRIRLLTRNEKKVSILVNKLESTKEAVEIQKK